MIDRNLLDGVRDDVFQLILMPTEKCNFRCVYCYEDFELGRMSAGTIAAIKNLISKRWTSLRALKISWFGGEPLNAASIVRDIMQHAIATQPAGTVLTSDMTTNGYGLNAAMLSDLLDLAVDGFQITFDGMPADHDRRRLLANGTGTFDVIWKNLIECSRVERDFSITARVHVYEDTVDRIPAFLEKLAGSFGGDERFSFFLKPIARLGGPNDAQISLLSGDGRKKLGEYADYGRSLGLKSVTDDTGYICYAAKPNSLVIRSDGALAKCTVAFNANRNKVGHIQSDGAIDVDGDKMNRWAAAMFSEKQAERQCPVGAVLGAA